MTKELADFLKKATEHCGQQEIDVREDYSGRGMMGRTTHAVVVDSVTELMMNCIQYIREGLEFNSPAITDFIPDVSDMGMLRTDNMARQTVLY